MLRAYLVSMMGIFAASCSSSASDGGTGGAGAEETSATVGGPANAVAQTSQGSGPSGTTHTSAQSGSQTSTGSGSLGNPPFAGSSGGSGGPAPMTGGIKQTGSVSYNLIVPSTYVAGTPTPFLLVYSGTEGGQQMTENLMSVGPVTGTDGFIEAVLDGVQYSNNGNAGASVLDDVRSLYDVDNDRTYLLGESAGTGAAEQLGFQLRESYFAAYWANDVVQAATPGQDATAIGFRPWGQVGPGGQQAIAAQIVAGMQASNYRTPSPAPYAGSGAGTHGDPQQFLAAVTWFVGKARM